MEAEEIFDLHGADSNGDTRGEAQSDRQRDKFDQSAKARQPHDNQQQSGHQGGNQQPRQAELLGNRIEDHHESGRWARYAETRTASQGDRDPRDGGGIQPVLRRHPAGNRQGHRQRNGDNTDGNTGDGIFKQALGGISFLPARLDERAGRAYAGEKMRLHYINSVNH